MNVLIVEDVQEQRDALVKIIEKEYIDIKVYSCKSIEEATEILELKEINLFLLDIKIIGGNGMELAKEIRSNPKYGLTGIVFITTEDIYLIEAFKEIHCYDFLVKPYNIEDIRMIIDTFKNNIDRVYTGKYTKFKIDGCLSVKVFHNDIIFVQCEGRDATIHTTNGKVLIKRYSLSNIIRLIGSSNIVQSHKSFAVNVKYIVKIEKIYNKLWFIYFKNYGKTAELGYKYKDNIVREIQ